MPHCKINGFRPISFYAPVVPCVYQPTCQSLQEEFDQKNAHYESRKKEVIGTYTSPFTAHASVTCQDYVCFLAITYSTVEEEVQKSNLCISPECMIIA